MAYWKAFDASRLMQVMFVRGSAQAFQGLATATIAHVLL
jgi:hypothetical protein